MWWFKSVSADRNSLAAGRDINITNISLEELQSAIAAATASATDPLKKINAEQQATISKLERQLGATQEQILSFLRYAGEPHVDSLDIGARLTEIAVRYKEVSVKYAELVSRNETETGTHPNLSNFLAQINDALKRGNVSKADELLVQLELDDASARERRALGAAEARARRGDLAMAQANYYEAFEHFVAAADHLPEGEVRKRLSFMNEQVVALLRRGEEFGDTKALFKAVERSHALLELRPRNKFPIEWSRYQHNLGNALLLLGIQKGNGGLVKDAEIAYKEALQEIGPVSKWFPLNWASTQDSLGSAYAFLASKQGSDNAFKKLTRLALLAYEAALDVYSDRAPLEWARTRINYAHALFALGKRSKSKGVLRKCIEAGQSALQRMHNRSNQFSFGACHHIMASALLELGDLGNNPSDWQAALMYENAAIQALEPLGSGAHAREAHSQLTEISKRLRNVGLDSPAEIFPERPLTCPSVDTGSHLTSELVDQIVKTTLECLFCDPTNQKPVYRADIISAEQAHALAERGDFPLVYVWRRNGLITELVLSVNSHAVIEVLQNQISRSHPCFDTICERVVQTVNGIQMRAIEDTCAKFQCAPSEMLREWLQIA